MENKGPNLIRVFALKERLHWIRIFKGLDKFNGIIAKILGWGLLSIFITIFHYIFAFPHFIFECMMYIFVKGQFKVNMKNLHADTLKKIEAYKAKPIVKSNGSKNNKKKSKKKR
jgi:hypothetical protein